MPEELRRLLIMRQAVDRTGSSVDVCICGAEDEDEQTTVEDIGEDFYTAFFDCDNERGGAAAFLAGGHGLQEERRRGGDAHGYGEDA